MKGALLFLVITASSLARAQTCAERTKHVGACYTVHGRLSYYNGGSSARIWPVGSKRLLGVMDGQLPPNIAEHMKEFDDQTFADFEVCPYTKQEPKKMQLVCINAAANPIFKGRDK